MHLSYELAKDLKESGFPLLFESWAEGQDEMVKLKWEELKDEYSPTLDELIGMCGRNFYSLTREGPYWKARGVSFGYTFEVRPEINAKSAMARLWLKLRQK